LASLSAESDRSPYLTSAKDEIWSTRKCPLAIPTQELVLRNDQGTNLNVVWAGRWADSKCSDTTRWALPGWYTVEAAAYGGEPGKILFQLQKPSAVAPSTTPAPSLAPGESLPTDAPTGKPSGAVEPSNN
jgi:hypothetical protein